MANARIQACGSFSPGVLIGNAQRTFTEQNGLNTSLPIYYLLVFDISVWGTTNENGNFLFIINCLSFLIFRRVKVCYLNFATNKIFVLRRMKKNKLSRI